LRNHSQNVDNITWQNQQKKQAEVFCAVAATTNGIGAELNV